LRVCSPGAINKIDAIFKGVDAIVFADSDRRLLRLMLPHKQTASKKKFDRGALR
jgi:hypothetical protein